MKSIIAVIMAAFAAQFLLCSCFVEKTVPPRDALTPRGGTALNGNLLS